MNITIITIVIFMYHQTNPAFVACPVLLLKQHCTEFLRMKSLGQIQQAPGNRPLEHNPGTPKYQRMK